MAVPVRSALRRSCREACGVVILSRLPATRDGGQTLRPRRQLARLRLGHGCLPPPLGLWQRLGGWLARHFSRSGAIKTF